MTPPRIGRHRCWILTSFVVLAIALGASTALAKATPQAKIFPPGSKPYGASYAEWHTRWWQWALSFPADINPLVTGDVMQGQTSPVVFLAGFFGGAEIDITIPPGTGLFFPIFNAECSIIEPDPFHGDDEAELRACADAFVDPVTSLVAEIDGVSVENLTAFRQQSPLFTIGPLPENNLLGVPAGSTSPSVDDGYYLMLAPLPVGEHTIHFRAYHPPFDLTIETTYNVTVEPGASLSGLGPISTSAKVKVSEQGSGRLLPSSLWGTIEGGIRNSGPVRGTWGSLKSTYR